MISGHRRAQWPPAPSGAPSLARAPPGAPTRRCPPAAAVARRAARRCAPAKGVAWSQPEGCSSACGSDRRVMCTRLMPCAVAVIRLLLLPQGVDLRGQVLHQQVGALHRGLAAVALQVTRRAAHAHLHVRHRRRRRQLGTPRKVCAEVDLFLGERRRPCRWAGEVGVGVAHLRVGGPAPAGCAEERALARRARKAQPGSVRGGEGCGRNGVEHDGSGVDVTGIMGPADEPPIGHFGGDA